MHDLVHLSHGHEHLVDAHCALDHAHAHAAAFLGAVSGPARIAAADFLRADVHRPTSFDDAASHAGYVLPEAAATAPGVRGSLDAEWVGPSCCISKSREAPDIAQWTILDRIAQLQLTLRSSIYHST